jgi:hypothetical protein
MRLPYDCRSSEAGREWAYSSDLRYGFLRDEEVKIRQISRCHLRPAVKQLMLRNAARGEVNVDRTGRDWSTNPAARAWSGQNAQYVILGEKINPAGTRLRFEISVTTRTHRGIEARLTRGCGLKGVFIKELISGGR